jgi:tetratricopeptide (TPR) repeat protein
MSLILFFGNNFERRGPDMNRQIVKQLKLAAVVASVLVCLPSFVTDRAQGQQPQPGAQKSVEQEVSALHEQARQLMSRRELDAALPLLEKALATAEQGLGAKHEKVVQSLTYLAYLYEAREDYARAEEMYRRALKITEDTEGAEHADVATLLGALAEMYLKKNDLAPVEPLLRRALAIREK